MYKKSKKFLNFINKKMKNTLNANGILNPIPFYLSWEDVPESVASAWYNTYRQEVLHHPPPGIADLSWTPAYKIMRKPPRRVINA